MLLRNWSVRAKLAALLVAASLLPLALSAWLDIYQTRQDLKGDMDSLLSARADQLAREFDGIHRSYLRSVQRISRQAVTRDFCAGDGDARAQLRDDVLDVLATFPATDPEVRGAGIVGATGHMLIATEAPLVGMDFSARSTVRSVLAGDTVISGVYLSSSATGARPTVAYLMPVRAQSGEVLCAVGLWVHAEAWWRALRASDKLAGPNSFGVLLDSHGVRIAHTRDDKALYRPTGPLDPAAVEQMVADQRFGPRTRALLTSVEPFPEQFERARAPAPDTGVFQGYAPSIGKVAWGVGRRLEHAGWTMFYMAPEENLTNQLADATRERLLLALGILAAALLVGVGFSASILRPVRELAGATASLTEGADAPHARVPVRGNDEFARLAASFNTMAARLAAQSASLRQANDVLEARVRERTGLLNGIIENSQAVIYAKDLDGRFLLVNDLFCKLLGVRREDVLGRTGHDLFDKATADALREVDERVARSPHALIEEEQVPFGGRVHTYLSSKAPLRGDDGKVHGIVGVSTDITERKLAEVRQLAQLERLSLLDQISTAIGARHDLHSIYGVVVGSVEERMPVDMCAICSFDAETGTLAVSRIGVRGRELALATGLVDSPPAVIPIDGNGLGRCVRGELVYEADVRGSAYAFPQGLARAGCHCVVLAPLMAENRVFGVLIAARCEVASFSSTDCEFLRQLSSHVALAAQQAQLTQALQRAYDDLRQSQQSLLQQERLSALGQMASGIAHDINNAISPASLYAESLLEQEKSLSEHARSRLTIIARAIDDVAATVARMREFYRHREPQSAMQPMDLNELVRQVVDLTRARWHDMPQQRGTVIDLHMDLEAPLPPVSGMESEIREALINLVFNAVDAMPQGGRLTVATRFDRAEGDVLLEVSDTGVGMDAETQRRCLEPFFTTKGERGTGLGLAMVYGVAQRNDADIDIRSAPGQGTTVCLRMPAGADDGARSRGVPEMQVPAARRILVVDDDVLVLRSLQEALQADGHAVTQAQGGEAGVAAFLQALRDGRPFDVVFTDLGMPGMDGLHVAQEIKGASPGTPVVLLTGWGQRLSESGDTELPPHVDRVLSKPPRLRELRAALSQGDAARGGTPT